MSALTTYFKCWTNKLLKFFKKCADHLWLVFFKHHADSQSCAASVLVLCSVVRDRPIRKQQCQPINSMAAFYFKPFCAIIAGTCVNFSRIFARHFLTCHDLKICLETPYVSFFTISQRFSTEKVTRSNSTVDLIHSKVQAFKTQKNHRPH